MTFGLARASPANSINPATETKTAKPKHRKLFRFLILPDFIPNSIPAHSLIRRDILAQINVIAKIFQTVAAFLQMSFQVTFCYCHSALIMTMLGLSSDLMGISRGLKAVA